MSDKRSDAELVELARERGDKAAYGELVKRYQGHVYALAYSLLGDWHEAEDIAQEAFVRAYVNLHCLETPSRFAAWLRRIAFGTCMDWMRRFRPELYRSMGEPEDVDEFPNEVLKAKSENMLGANDLVYFGVPGGAGYGDSIKREPDRVLADIKAGRTPRVEGTGNEVQDFVYVGDVARANVLALESAVSDTAYNIVSGVPVIVREVIVTVLRV